MGTSRDTCEPAPMGIESIASRMLARAGYPVGGPVPYAGALDVALVLLGGDVLEERAGLLVRKA